MNKCTGYGLSLPPEQEAIRAKLIRPEQILAKFTKEEVEQSIPARFEKIVRFVPDRISIKTVDRSVTYAELNNEANRVAHGILARRGSISEPVGILLDKGIEQIAAMLGVLKAGKFFVLLDPSLPKERTVTMLEHSQTGLLVADQRNLALAHKLDLSGDRLMDYRSVRSEFAINDPSFPGSPSALAYLMYTSGSTGRPKGIVHSHRNVLHSIMLRSIVSPVFLEDRVAFLTAGTASAVTNPLMALLYGATLLPFDVRKEGVSCLATWLQSEKITFLWISSPLFRNLCNVLTGLVNLTSVRLLRLASEKVYKTDIDLYKRHFPPSCVLIVLLASSEAGPHRCFYMDHETIISGAEIPVGYEIKDKEILLLDDGGNPVGFNTIGEIAVRSRYLSLGYWRQPRLTEAKFKPDPDDPDTRLYFTGDLGLMLPDGCLIHKGRKDFRVKIRGYGVDLVEVEKALSSHYDIREAVVTAPKTESGEARLIGYYTCPSEPGPTIGQLRRFLQNQLPDYMIPSTFVKLDTMPLTLNGKVDRQSLPVPDNWRPNLDAPFVGPQDATEEKLVKIWAEVLGVDKVGIHDNFFDLGGHSLLTTRLCIQIQKQFGKKLPEVTIYHAPTVEQFAKILVQESWSAPWSLMAPIQPRGSRPPFFWSMEGAGDFRLVNYLDPNQPLYALMHQCHNGKRAIYGRLEDIAAHHLEEIRAVQPQGPYFLGGYCFGGMVAFEMAQQLQGQGEEVALLVLLDLADLKNCKPLRRQITGNGDSSPKLRALGVRLSRHLGNVGQLSFREKLTYVWVRVMATIRALIGWGDDIVKSVTCKICCATGYPLSTSLQGFNIYAVDGPILGQYDPREYSGRVVLIKAKDSDWDTRFMRRLLTGQVEFHEVPGYHWDLRKEPFGRAWAEIVKSSLEKAHNRISQARA